MQYRDLKKDIQSGLSKLECRQKALFAFKEQFLLKDKANIKNGQRYEIGRFYNLIKNKGYKIKGSETVFDLELDGSTYHFSGLNVYANRLAIYGSEIYEFQFHDSSLGQALSVVESLPLYEEGCLALTEYVEEKYEPIKTEIKKTQKLKEIDKCIARSLLEVQLNLRHLSHTIKIKRNTIIIEVAFTGKKTATFEISPKSVIENTEGIMSVIDQALVLSQQKLVKVRLK